ncbi:MAG: PHP-associated domain-containing protein [Candidatus Helarchaeota archaeon]
MLIDMHIHTKPKSPCSNIDPEDAIKEAIDIGLDGIVFTEHNKYWSLEELQALREKYDILILNGVEITAREGDLLLYNFNTLDSKLIEGLPKAIEIRNVIGQNNESFLAIAHPFREFLVVGIGDLGLDLNEVLNMPIFDIVDGIEVLNGQVSRRANRLAMSVCKKRELIGIGGSDAHELIQIGRCITEFNRKIRNEKELVYELFNGNFNAKYFRKK